MVDRALGKEPSELPDDLGLVGPVDRPVDRRAAKDGDHGAQGRAFGDVFVVAGLDAVELRKQYGHSLSFYGNMDVQKWADLPLDELEAYVLKKLNAAKGGGYIFQSDHSVSGDVSGKTYDYIVGLVRKYGQYPIDLKELEMEISKNDL